MVRVTNGIINVASRFPLLSSSPSSGKKALGLSTKNFKSSVSKSSKWVWKAKRCNNQGRTVPRGNYPFLLAWSIFKLLALLSPRTYSPLKSAFRFSTKAAAPSAKSFVPEARPKSAASSAKSLLA